MFGTIRGLIPEPRQADQPRHYVGRHRHTEVTTAGQPRSGQRSTEPDPDAPTRELAAAAAAAMAPEPDAGADPRP